MRPRPPSMSIHEDLSTMSGSLESLKRSATVSQYYIPSQSSLRLSSTLGNVLDQQHSKDSDPVQRPWVASSQELWMVACFAVIAALVSLDAMMMVTILPDISHRYHSDLATETLWPVTVYFLANAVTQRIFVAMTDVFGRRIMLYSAVVIFTIGTVVLSATPALFPILIVGRALQGIGSGGMVAIPSEMLIEMIPTQRRSRYNCIILLCAAIGVGTGPVVGGLFTENGSAENAMAWRWIYWISAPYCLVLLIAIPFAVQPVGEFLSPTMRLLSIDWTGVSILCASMAGLLIGITWSGGGDPSTNWRTLLALVAGGIGMMCWLLYERSGATKPLFSFSILSKSPLTFFCIFLHALLMFGQVFYIPVYLREVHQLTPSLTGAHLAAITATTCVVAAIIGVITARFGHFRWAIWFGWALNIVASTCMILFDTATGLGICAAVFAVAGLGHGLTISASHTAIERLADASSVCDAALIANFLQAGGMCLAVAAVGASFQSRTMFHMVELGAPKLAAEVLVESLQFGVDNISFPPSLAEISRHAYALSFHDIMQALTVLAGFGGFLSIFVGWTAKRR